MGRACLSPRVKSDYRMGRKNNNYDTMSSESRSAVMSRIRGKNTKPELIVRSLLHRLGFRFRLHDRSLPGCPDIVLRGIKTVIFVHGCFWHRHTCGKAYRPKTRREFWKNKFIGNVARDKKNISQLKHAGWRSILVWECETKHSGRLANA